MKNHRQIHTSQEHTPCKGATDKSISVERATVLYVWNKSSYASWSLAVLHALTGRFPTAHVQGESFRICINYPIQGGEHTYSVELARTLSRGVEELCALMCGHHASDVRLLPFDQIWNSERQTLKRR